MSSAAEKLNLKSLAPDNSAAIELEGFLPYRLNVLATSVSQSLAKVYGDRFGISIPEWRVLATLGQFKEFTAREIGLHSHMHKTTVSRAVAALAERQLIARRPNRDDMREAFLTMTPKGQVIYLEIVPLARAFAEHLAEGLSHEELQLLDGLISRLMGRVARLESANEAENV
ncbi:MAG: MarR family winged helix-turn-helix transcriptional regulator [Rhabdaerophilum sp.]